MIDLLVISYVAIFVTLCSSPGSSTERSGGDEGRSGQHESGLHHPATVSTRTGRDGDDGRIAQSKRYGLFTPDAATAKALHPYLSLGITSVPNLGTDFLINRVTNKNTQCFLCYMKCSQIKLGAKSV